MPFIRSVHHRPVRRVRRPGRARGLAASRDTVSFRVMKTFWKQRRWLHSVINTLKSHRIAHLKMANLMLRVSRLNKNIHLYIKFKCVFLNSAY